LGHGRIWEWLYPDEGYRKTITEKADAIIKKGEVVEDFETVIRRKGGRKRTISWHSRNLTDERGKSIGSLALGRDITEQKRAEARLRKSLQEKELLLKEIHHRVNSNMQIVSSLLSLQAGQIRDSEIRDLFKDGQSRIRSLALVHEMLYQSGDLTRIDFSQYIRDLSVYLFQTYKVDPQRVRLNIQADDIPLDINTAIPCGLILNELISNALKHAFPPEDEPRASDAGGRKEIRIRFTSEDEGNYSLSVSDNGIGLPPDLDVQNTESLGLQLVNMLAYQLKSSVDVQRNRGTSIRLAFRSLEYELYS
jgi:two-component sensor histidine kinase